MRQKQLISGSLSQVLPISLTLETATRQSKTQLVLIAFFPVQLARALQAALVDKQTLQSPSTNHSSSESFTAAEKSPTSFCSITRCFPNSCSACSGYHAIVRWPNHLCSGILWNKNLPAECAEYLGAPTVQVCSCQLPNCPMRCFFVRSSGLHSARRQLRGLVWLLSKLSDLSGFSMAALSLSLSLSEIMSAAFSCNHVVCSSGMFSPDTWRVPNRVICDVTVENSGPTAVKS